MANKFLFANNDTTTLASSIGPSATTASLAAGTGVLFPQPTAGQQFAMTFIDAATGLDNEIVYVTSRTGDVITMVRGQEGSGAQSWNAGDIAASLLTAGQMQSLIQSVDILLASGQFAIDAGTENALNISLSPAITSLNDILGSPIRILKSATINTGAMTITVNGLTSALVNANGGVMWAGELQAQATFTVVYSGSEFTLQSLPGPLNITLGSTGSLPLSRLPASSANANGGLSAVYEWAGNPNGNVAGQAASSTTPPDMVWDRLNIQLWVCTSSGVAAAAVWARANTSSAIPLSTSIVSATGAYSVTPPAGARVADISANGAGGGGGGVSASNGAASGGGGGAFIRVVLALTTGNITGVVGVGGTASDGSTSSTAGGNTTVIYGSTYTAGGGNGGLSASGNAQNSVSGGSPSGSGFLASLVGQPSNGGLQGFQAGPAVLFYGGGGGLSPNGGFGGISGTGAASAGGTPGGGGGGAGGNGGILVAGGAGGDGQVTISFYA